VIVVADSEPLHYLILLGQTELLRGLYGQGIVPDPVADELRTAAAPQAVSEWIARPPARV
jgi:predicted nucleic acid-binding protein